MIANYEHEDGKCFVCNNEKGKPEKASPASHYLVCVKCGVQAIIKYGSGSIEKLVKYKESIEQKC